MNDKQIIKYQRPWLEQFEKRLCWKVVLKSSNIPLPYLENRFEPLREPYIRHRDRSIPISNIYSMNSNDYRQISIPFLYTLNYERYDLMENNQPLTSFLHLIPPELIDMINQRLPDLRCVADIRTPTPYYALCAKDWNVMRITEFSGFGLCGRYSI